MNIEPWVRLGIRISPKIRENPADSRNSRPPNVTLLTVSSSQNVISAALALAELPSALRQRWIIARVDRMRQKFLFGPSPELADILIGLDDLVPEFEAVFGAFRPAAPDIEVADDVAEAVELERSARRVGQSDGAERG